MPRKTAAPETLACIRCGKLTTRESTTDPVHCAGCTLNRDADVRRFLDDQERRRRRFTPRPPPKRGK